jgi:DNA-binding CsgD family transcriptional regulator
MDLPDQFSKKEIAVIELLLQGKSNKQIAFLLHVTPRTIEYHLTNIYSKIGVNSRSEAILFITKNFTVFPSKSDVADLRESTVVSPAQVGNNTITQKPARRRLMLTRRFIYTTLGLLACVFILYLIVPYMLANNGKTSGNAPVMEISVTPTPSPVNPQPGLPSDEQLGLHTLVDFLTYLYEGDYEKAAQLYGGSYEIMLEHNPEMDPNDHAALLQNACTINGAQCLRIFSAGPTSAGPYESYELANQFEFTYQVEFADDDGTRFVLGPCCGANATDSPPQSIFYFTVVKVEPGRFLVMDMPPYAP